MDEIVICDQERWRCGSNEKCRKIGNSGSVTQCGLHDTHTRIVQHIMLVLPNAYLANLCLLFKGDN